MAQTAPETAQTQRRTKARNRARQLDGLRALAIAAIVCYHLHLPGLPSGHLGVVVFLVLGGYLQTTSIVRAWRRGTSGIKGALALWWGRIRRIWPSAAFVVAATCVLAAVFNHVLLTKLRPDVVPALGLYLNWSYIANAVSYFEQIGGTSPLLHLWYIAIDVQLFFAWSVLCLILLPHGRKVTRRCALLLAIASAVWMWYCYVPDADPSRVYYGTDTRAHAMLLGAWLALVLPLRKTRWNPSVLLRRLRGTHATPHASVLANLLALLSLAGLATAMVLVPAESPYYYLGGFAAAALVATLLIAMLLIPESLIARLLALPPLAWLGTRAFALYLWHYPIIALFAADKTTTPWQLRVTAIGVALVAAELTVHLVERPLSPRFRVRHRDGRVTPPHPVRVALPIVATVALMAYGVYALRTTESETLVPEDAIVSTGVGAGTARDLASEADADEVEKTEAPQTGLLVDDEGILRASDSELAAGVFDPVLIGDSVPGDAFWDGRMPNLLNDCYIGRRPEQALTVLSDYIAQNVVGQVVILACFSNTTPYPDTIEALIEAAGPERIVYLVGTFNPEGFQEAANNNLRDVADLHDNVHFVDWASVVADYKDAYLWADDTHLRPEGATVYVDLIADAIAADLEDAAA